MTPEVKKLREQVKKLRARVRHLESLLTCIHCGHLRHEHDGEEGGPCFGGRTPEMKPGEGEYCDCPGFEAAED